MKQRQSYFIFGMFFTIWITSGLLYMTEKAQTTNIFTVSGCVLIVILSAIMLDMFMED